MACLPHRRPGIQRGAESADAAAADTGRACLSGHPDTGTRLDTGHVYVTFNKPVNLVGVYTLNNGAVVTGVPAYGSSHSEVVLTATGLTANNNYCLTVQGVTAEDGSTLTPDPSTKCFFHGVGNFCTDFESGVPANSTVTKAPIARSSVVSSTYR